MSRTYPLENTDILVVDDEPIIGMDVAFTMESAGADVREHSSCAEDALSRIASKCPDIAVLDYNLGQTTSYPIAERLNELGVPYVIYTGATDITEIRDALPGATIVRKPVDPDLLVRVVADQLNIAA